MAERKIKLAKMNPDLVNKEIGDFVLEDVTNRKATGCVIGLSGGVDSTATAAIIKSAFDRYNLFSNGQSLELVGYILPSKINHYKDTEDGVDIAKQLGIRYEVHSIEGIVEAHKLTNPEAFEFNYHKGNMVSRIRPNILSTKSATERKILAGTGNRDEDFGIGYYTLFGDGAVHLSPIGNLPKRLVREIADYHGFSDIAKKIPSAGLEPGQTDFGDLGYSYDFVELVSEGLMQGFEKKELYGHKQIIGLSQKDIVQYANLYGSPKLSNSKDMIDDILRRHNIAIDKANLIHPRAAPVTLIYE